MDIKYKLLDIVNKRVDVAGIAEDVVEQILEEALKKVVADSSNKLDDMLMASIYPLLKVEMIKLIRSMVDKIDVGDNSSAS